MHTTFPIHGKKNQNYSGISKGLLKQQHQQQQINNNLRLRSYKPDLEFLQRLLSSNSSV